MRVFVAGATGAVGRALVHRLLAKGHAVVGMTHTPSKAEALRKQGVEPVVADGLDAEASAAAVSSSRPDVIVHEMTDLSGMSDLRKLDRTFAMSNRLRTEGTDNLLAAARAAGVGRLVAQSYCGWPYARTGEFVKTETDELDTSPPSDTRRTLGAIQYLERTVTGSAAPEGIVLRYGTFYGRGTGMLSPAAVEQVRHRRFPVIGDGNGWWSFVDVDDAAAATVLAIERGKAGELYNIVDDEPAPAREWVPALAAALGAKPPLRMPAWIARLMAGDQVVLMMTKARAGSNAKAKRELGWRPDHPSWRQGFAECIDGGVARRVTA